MMRQSIEMIAFPIHLRLAIHLLGMESRRKKLRKVSLWKNSVPKRWLNASSNYLKILLMALLLKLNGNWAYGAQENLIYQSSISIHTHIFGLFSALMKNFGVKLL